MRTYSLRSAVIGKSLVLCLLIAAIAFPISLSSADDIFETLRDKWTAMTDSLKKGDTQSALGYIYPGSRIAYKEMFEAIGPEVKAITATQTGFKIKEIREDYAKCELTTEENGTTYSYEVVFLKDKDGNWWIYEY